MEQVAIFNGDTMEGMEKSINKWLCENGNKIEIVSRVMSQSAVNWSRHPVVTIAIFYKLKGK